VNDFTKIDMQNDDSPFDQAPEALDPTQDLLIEGSDASPAIIDDSSQKPASKYY
jgi:hypothetical protein